MIDWTPELEDKIFTLIATSSKGIDKICKENNDLPTPSTIWKRISEDEQFSEKYARAKEWQADFMADEIMDIADTVAEERELSNEKINAAKLRVEARKWAASKLKPKKYGDKVDVTSGGDKLPLITTVEVVHVTKPHEE